MQVLSGLSSITFYVLMRPSTIAEARQKIVSGKIKNINDNDKNKLKVFRSFTQPKSNNQNNILLKTEAGDKLFKEELSHFYGELYRSRILNCAQLDDVWDDCETLRCVNWIIDFSDEEYVLRNFLNSLK